MDNKENNEDPEEVSPLVQRRLNTNPNLKGVKANEL